MAQEEKKKKNRLGYMILSVIIAIIAWTAVTYTTDPDITKTFAGVRVELAGEEALTGNGYVVTGRDDIPKISVKVRGKRSDLIKALDKARVIVDVSMIDEEGNYEIEGTVKLPNSRIIVEKISLQTIPITVEKLETKDVPVRIKQTGERSGALVKTSPAKDTISVKGAKYELDLIEAAEVSVDISTVTDNSSVELGYSLVLADGVAREDFETLIITENVINVDNTIYQTKDVPVMVIAKSETEYVLDKEKTETDPQTVKIGIGEGVDLEHVIVVLEENCEAGEYKIEKPEEAVYIPDYSKTINVKPVWKKTN